MTEQPDLSGKLYYTISEVSDLTGVKAHVLRYWESEFPSLRPRKDRGGSRRYRQRDIEEILAIRSLLYQEGYRIAGARKLLAQRRREATEAVPESAQLAIAFDQLEPAEQVAFLRRELAEVLDLAREEPPKKAMSAEG
ncbi:MAG TPA: MerR family transcriptional regulator [Candidatus Krumholzibacteria bacterium]|nr:MerR family transcriptional regulator [Candidatus Krumholzibacteria bacterium]HPD71545.1 MerR family transcriptional regulator [Candidatus Krumholzibacteria bacterium]HRY41522.1 MerR family transcriptional regulator [Candidatus Krumholzibacteria bacterium]